MSLPVRIALTGSIGSGKSTAARVFAGLGAVVVSGDELGKRALAEFPELLSEIRKRFGDGVIGADGNLDRRELGRRVFADRANVVWLTELTFPAIHDLWRREVAGCAAPAIVFDAALIFEWKIERQFDFVVTVAADRQLVESRSGLSERWSGEELKARCAAQLSPEEKAARSDAVIVNDGSMEQLDSAVRQFYTEIVVPEIKKRSELRHE